MRVKIPKTYVNRFCFADNIFESICQVTLQLGKPYRTRPVFVNLDVVNAEIPVLLGMDIFERESLSPDTVGNRL